LVTIIAITHFFFCSVSKKFSSEFGYRIKLDNLHDKADQIYHSKSYSDAIPIFEELIAADSTFIYPNDRVSLYNCYASLSRFADADTLLKNTLASVSKMKRTNSKVEFPRKFERLLYNYKAKEKRKAQTAEWIEKKKAQDSTLVVAYDTPPEPIGGFVAIQQNMVYPEAA